MVSDTRIPPEQLIRAPAALRERARLMRRAAAISTSGSADVDRMLLIMAEQLEQEADTIGQQDL